MALTYLQLTNRTLKALNEVELTSSNFSTATGFHQEVKDAVNQAVFDVYQEEDMAWDFAFSSTTFSTVIGTREYSKDATAERVIWNSFRINADVGNSITADSLHYMDYDQYRNNQVSQAQLIDDLNRTSSNYAKPEFVVRKNDNSIILTPTPDAVYTIYYEFYATPTALSAYDDTTDIPDFYEQVIVDKALHYAYMFRDNVEQAALAESRYEKKVNRMRRIRIPQAPYARFE